MLGWINLSVQAFITDTFGLDKWLEVVNQSGQSPNWVSSCPYSDKVTYDLVVTAAGLLGVQVNDALEAYGLYFIQYLADQGYTKLLAVLGSNVAEFLQNLNNLHLHLQYCWPDMVPPAFRCEQVTPESLLLHYNSSRPGLWPIVVGVLKGIAANYFKMPLTIKLLHSRDKGDCDHEVFLLTYPYQEELSDWGDASAAAQQSMLSIPAPMFFSLHPFHLVLDSKMQLLQWGAAVGRIMPGIQIGQQLRQHFKCKHPGHVLLDFEQIKMHTNNHFVLQARNSVFTLKGQMLPTQLQLPGSAPGSAPTPVLVFLGSPRVRSLLEMQQSGIYFSDIPLHDMSADYILLAEQRQAEADLKDKYERLTMELKAANDKLAATTAWLEEEKARAEALLMRMSGLIACFPCGPGESPQQLAAVQQAAATVMAECQSQAHQMVGTVDGSGGSGLSNTKSTALDRIEAVRRELAKANIDSSESMHIQCLELLGEGTYGKVYKALWKGSIVAVKTIVLPAAMSGQEKREKMAIMEAAISSALSHPNIMQTYTYDIKPIKDNSRNSENKLVIIGSTHGSSTRSSGGAAGGGGGGMSQADGGGNVHSYEVRLLCEYCDKGSLREALDLGAFKLQDGSLNYPAVLDTGVEIVTAVLHLHNRNVLHSDLKARNIMLKSSGSEGRGVTAKIADFGLAVKMDHMETHLSNAFQGTMTHMAPEIMIKGHISKAADVYALGMVLWELYTAKHVFRGTPRALLGHQITLLNRRPEFPANAPEDYVKLVQQCWDPSPANRPVLEAVLEKLQAMRAALRCATQPLSSYDIEGHITRKHSISQQQQSPRGQQPSKPAPHTTPGQSRSRAGIGGAGSPSQASRALQGQGQLIGQRSGLPKPPDRMVSAAQPGPVQGQGSSGQLTSSSGRSDYNSAINGAAPGDTGRGRSALRQVSAWQEESERDYEDGESEGSEGLLGGRSIYLEHSASTDMAENWKAVMMMDELSVGSMATACGDSVMAGLHGPHGVAPRQDVPAVAAAAGGGAAGGRCPFGHGAAAGGAAAAGIGEGKEGVKQ